MRKIVLFITFIASSAMLQAQEYLSLGYGASYGYYQRIYDDELYASKSNELLFRPIVFNIRYGLDLNDNLDLIFNSQYAWHSQQTGDIIEGISNWLITTGVSGDLKDSDFYLVGKLGAAVVRRAIGATIIPGIGWNISPHWQLESEVVFGRTVIDYNFTNFGLIDTRWSLHYRF